MTTSIYAKNSTQSAIQTNGIDSLIMDAAGVVSGVDNGFKPLSAVTTANTIVITMGQCSTIFRPTTLATGVPVQLSNISPLTLTIPQGATLGSVNGVASRYIVLEINNAGTKELAVVNQAGSVNLNEMGLLSTTAISSGATSASVVYSTTARTSVAYRVVGCLDSTQATAGTYVTNLSLVQPTNTTALAVMYSLGVGQTWSNPTRSVNTTYYNTTGKPILVAVSLQYTGGAGEAQAFCAVGGVNVLFLDTNLSVNGYYQTHPSTGTFVVPHGSSYSVIASGQISTIDLWAELR